MKRIESSSSRSHVSFARGESEDASSDNTWSFEVQCTEADELMDLLLKMPMFLIEARNLIAGIFHWFSLLAYRCTNIEIIISSIHELVVIVEKH